MEYLIYSTYKEAQNASFSIWVNMTENKTNNIEDVTNSYSQPIELENGSFVIPKPEDKYMENVTYLNIKKENEIQFLNNI